MREHFLIHTPRGYVGQRRSMGRLYDNVSRDEAAIFASFEHAVAALVEEFRDGEILPTEAPVVSEPERRDVVEQAIIERRTRENEILAQDYPA